MMFFVLIPLGLVLALIGGLGELLLALFPLLIAIGIAAIVAQAGHPVVAVALFLVLCFVPAALKGLQKIRAALPQDRRGYKIYLLSLAALIGLALALGVVPSPVHPVNGQSPKSTGAFPTDKSGDAQQWCEKWRATAPCQDL